MGRTAALLPTQLTGLLMVIASHLVAVVGGVDQRHKQHHHRAAQDRTKREIQHSSIPPSSVWPSSMTGATY